MAVNPRFKKAKLLRDHMIETNTANMFQEEEKGENIFFRTHYDMCGEKKQAVLTINDSVYAGLQVLLVQNIPAEKNAAVLEGLNKCNLEMPTIKYVLTNDQCIVASMFYEADDKTFNPGLALGLMIQVLKSISEKHYDIIKKIVA